MLGCRVLETHCAVPRPPQLRLGGKPPQSGSGDGTVGRHPDPPPGPMGPWAVAGAGVVTMRAARGAGGSRGSGARRGVWGAGLGRELPGAGPFPSPESGHRGGRGACRTEPPRCARWPLACTQPADFSPPSSLDSSFSFSAVSFICCRENTGPWVSHASPSGGTAVTARGPALHGGAVAFRCRPGLLRAEPGSGHVGGTVGAGFSGQL